MTRKSLSRQGVDGGGGRWREEGGRPNEGKYETKSGNDKAGACRGLRDKRTSARQRRRRNKGRGGGGEEEK